MKRSPAAGRSRQPPSLRATARAFNKDVPAELSEVVMRALHRDPAQRYDSVEDFAMALEPFGTLQFHSTAAARDTYAQTLRIRRKSKGFRLPRSPLARGVAAVWIAAITVTVGWLVTRAVLREPAIEPSVHVAAPAPPPPAPARHDIVLPAAEPAPLPQGISPAPPPAPEPQQPAKSLRDRGVRKVRSAEPAAAPATRSSKTDILDPWN
jgi:hypothetical protein